MRVVLIALYRVLLRGYPRAVRDRFGDEQLHLFVEVLREERPVSRLARVPWLVGLFLRGASAGLAFHWDAVRRRRARREGRAPGSAWSTIMNDLRHAARYLRRSPAYAVTVSAVVALGIALAATTFALVDGVLFKPLPYRAPHELFAVRGVLAGTDPIDAARSVSPRELRGWQAAVPDATFSASGNVVGHGTLGVINGPTVWSRTVDARFWDVVGVRPLLGGFAPADYDANLPIRPAIISHALWQRVYGGAADLVGQRIDAGASTFRVAGVLPPGFIFPTGERQAVPDILLPLVLDPEAAASPGRYLQVIARVPARLDDSSVIPALERAARAAIGPGDRTPPFNTVTLTPLGQIMAAQERTPAAIASAAAAVLVLLVAVNIGGLVASRSQDRARETAARRALGARWLDLVRLQAIEVGYLAMAGAMAGTVLAKWLLIETARRLPPDIVLLRTPNLDVRVIAAVLLTALLVALIATTAGVRATNRDSLTSILGQGAGAALSHPRRLSRFLLQAGQVALAVALVVGGALFVTSLQRVWTTDAGYQMDNALYLDVRLGRPSSAAAGTDAGRTLDLLRVIRMIPGVERASVIDTILLERARRGNGPVQPVAGQANDAVGELIPVSSHYFEMAGFEPIEGRLPTPAEMDEGALVAVVSERTAREYWPGRPAVGQLLSSKRGALAVIGVVKDARFRALDVTSSGEIYAPLALGLWSTTAAHFLVQTPLPDDRILPAVIDAVRRYDAGSSIRRAQVVSTALAESVKRRRFHAWLFGMMAIAGLLIAGAGIFGLVAGATARRTREMGIRLALGSTRDRLIRLLVREQLAPVIAGVIAGGLATAWAGGYVAALLYQVSAYDLRVWAAAAAVVVAVAAAGALVPALRASRVDPIVALRVE